MNYGSSIQDSVLHMFTYLITHVSRLQTYPVRNTCLSPHTQVFPASCLIINYIII